jgi:hypothetical protein
MNPAVSDNRTDAPAGKPRFWKRMLAGRLLIVSLSIHLLLGLGATYLVIEHFQAKRQVTFQGSPGTPNASARALEHQINMARRQQSMSAPAQARRIMSTGLSKITLPDMPSVAASDDFEPEKMAGLGGMGVDFGAGGGGGGGGNGTGRGVTLFGMHDAVAGFEGTFYDLRTQPGGNVPIPGMNFKAYEAFLKSFSRNGLVVDAPHYTSPVKLYASHFFLPVVKSPEAGAAFQSRTHPDGLWIIHYIGTCVAPEDGNFRFVGFADNILFADIDGRMVLDASDHWNPGHPRQSAGRGVKLPGKSGDTPLYFGDWFNVSKGQTLKVDVVCGDEGGIFAWGLFIQKDGQPYSQGLNNIPALPLFTLAPFTPAEKGQIQQFLPPEAFTGEIWTGKPATASTTSDLDSLIPGQ